jgi:hypothetical protein
MSVEVVNDGISKSISCNIANLRLASEEELWKEQRTHGDIPENVERNQVRRCRHNI